MRQVGVRDHAKFIGGYGKCGRPLCCSVWLREFEPVSIKMAKQQDLPLNASEVSGLCGRLLCCLSYENDFYTEARRQMPRINSVLMTPEGPGKVKQVHVLASSVTVQVEGPNETRLMIDIPVAEPVFGDAGLKSADQRPKSAGVDEAVDLDELDSKLPSNDNPVATPPSQERSGSRRRPERTTERSRQRPRKR
jgi:hypothetical protein